MTYNLDLDRVKVNQLVKYLGQRSFHSKVMVHRHTTNQLLYRCMVTKVISNE